MAEDTAIQDVVDQSRSIPEFKSLNRRQRRFLMAYAGAGQILKAATLASIPWGQHYRWVYSDELYKQAWEKTRDIWGDHLESEIFRRAYEGEDKPIIREGNIIGVYKQKSDVLAMFALKGLKPQYRDNFQINQFIGPTQFTVSGPKPVSQATQVIDVTKDKL